MKFKDIIEFVIVFAFIFGILISWSSIKDTDKLTVFGKIGNHIIKTFMSVTR